jgi:hypothetical protein
VYNSGIFGQIEIHFPCQMLEADAADPAPGFSPLPAQMMSSF